MKKILFLLLILPKFLFSQAGDLTGVNLNSFLDTSLIKTVSDTIPLFKPGPYSAGDLVKDNYGTIWRARKDIKNAVSPPSYNSYWEPATIPPPVPVQTGLVADGITDNFPILQAMIDKLTVGEIKVPAGDYYFSNTISWFNKSIWLIGSNGTRFIFKNGVTGIVVSRDRYFPPSRIENLIIETFGVKQGSSNGVEIHSITDLSNVTVKNFAGNGFSYTADIAAGKTDVSHSLLFRCTAKENGGNGFLFQGGDANAINVIACSASDNGGVGFYDNSFLGNNFIGSMAHANAGGHYKVDGGNARASYFGSYAEEDSPPSQFGGIARSWGGLLGWRVYKGSDGKLYYSDNNEPYHGTGGHMIISPNAKVDSH